MQLNRSIIAKSASAVGLVVCSAVILLTQTAYAQDASSQGSATTPPSAQGFRHGHHAHQTLDQRLSALKTKLQIQPGQEGAWQTYVTAVQTAQANQKALWQSNQSPESLPLPQRIDAREAMMQQMAANRQAMNAALKTLYGSLTTEQQTILDQRFAHKGHGGPGM